MLDKIETPSTYKTTDISEQIQSRKRRQLVIFINLPGVAKEKISTFLEHAKQRSMRLGLTCSALHISLNTNLDLITLDMKQKEAEIYTLLPSSRGSLNKFINQIDVVEGYYDHILIMGEMHQTDKKLRTEHNISNIENLEKLSKLVLSLSETYSANESWHRVQVCQSNSVKIKSSDITFANAVIPTTGISHLSAPFSWSIVGKNGLAIDFISNNQEIIGLIPFMHKVVSNAWDDERARLEFEKYSPQTTCTLPAHLSFDLLYPQKQRPGLFYSQFKNPDVFFKEKPPTHSRSTTPVMNLSPMEGKQISSASEEIHKQSGKF